MLRCRCAMKRKRAKWWVPSAGILCEKRSKNEVGMKMGIFNLILTYELCNYLEYTLKREIKQS